MATAGIQNRFNQPGYLVYRSLEDLLIKAANQKEYAQQFDQVTSFFGDDIQPQLLSSQLQIFSDYFKPICEGGQKIILLKECVAYLRELSSAHKEFYSEVCTIARLILVMPATNATSERSFSAMRRVKTYLRSTMHQQRLNHLMFLSIHKDKLDSLDIKTTANEFVQGSEHSLSYFGKF